MKRRDFITAWGCAAVSSWTIARAQPRAPRHIGVLMPYAENDPEGQSNISAFREELRRLGWIQGRNIVIETRWAALDTQVIQQYAKELVALQPDLILSPSTTVTAALLQQTRAVPIVFVNIGDPIGSGFVASFSRPGGNATGFIPMEGSVAGKWLELLKEIAPRVNRVGFLYNPAMAPNFDHFLGPLRAASKSVAVQVVAAPVRDRSDLESVISAQAREPNSGLVLMPDSFNVAHSGDIVSLAARLRVPVVYPFRFFAEQGGLLSYGNDRRDNFRSAATYADLILKGEKPGNLPVQAPTKYELVINTKTAKALGLSIPQTLRARAELIE